MANSPLPADTAEEIEAAKAATERAEFPRTDRRDANQRMLKELVFSVPATEAVRIHPYLLGWLLGDIPTDKFADACEAMRRSFAGTKAIPADSEPLDLEDRLDAAYRMADGPMDEDND